MEYQDDFESRMLYDQSCITEEGLRVYTAVYAVLWSYPGALSKTTARIKISSVYSYDNHEIDVVAATIEKWRNEGWSLLDDYHDTRHSFTTISDLRDRLMCQAKSFLMGIPLTKIDSSYVPMSPHSPSSPDEQPAAPSKPVLKIIQYTKDKGATKDIVNKSKHTKSDDDDDFDFI